MANTDLYNLQAEEEERVAVHGPLMGPARKVLVKLENRSFGVATHNLCKLPVGAIVTNFFWNHTGIVEAFTFTIGQGSANSVSSRFVTAGNLGAGTGGGATFSKWTTPLTDSTLTITITGAALAVDDTLHIIVEYFMPGANG